MLNLDNKKTYLCESGSGALIVIEKVEKHGSGYFFKYEIYFKDLKSCYDKFELHNVGEIFAYSFDEAYKSLNRKLYKFKYNY